MVCGGVHAAGRQRDAVLTCCSMVRAAQSCECGCLELVVVVQNIPSLREGEHRLFQVQQQRRLQCSQWRWAVVVACVAGRRRPDLGMFGSPKYQRKWHFRPSTPKFFLASRRSFVSHWTLGLPPQTPVRTHTPVSRYGSSPPRDNWVIQRQPIHSASM